MHISASILACDLLNIQNSITKLTGVDSIHFDVMDGHYVDPISFGSGLFEQLKRSTTLPIYVHLMVNNPLHQVEIFKDAGAEYISFHPIDEKSTEATLKMLNNAGIRAGLAVHTQEELRLFKLYHDLIEHVTVMTVTPGASRQSFDINKIDLLKCVHAYSNQNIEIFVDGGINNVTCKICQENGATALILGGYIFDNLHNIESIIKQIKC